MLAIIMAIENDEERHFIEQIYENYKYAMFRVAFSVLKDEDKAEDAVSSAFEKIIKHVGKYKTIPDEKIKGLVVIVVRNISINMLIDMYKGTNGSNPLFTWVEPSTIINNKTWESVYK